jgi:hypothetical protein
VQLYLCLDLVGSMYDVSFHPDIDIAFSRFFNYFQTLK